MKKIILWVIGVCLAAAALVAVYRFAFRKSIPEGVAESEQVAAILQQNGCYDCHDATAKMPFYSKLPIAGPMLGKHTLHGNRFIDLKAKDLEKPSEVLLSMLEYTVQQGNMPIVEYKLAHWGCGYNKEEKSLLTKWIMEKRAEMYASGLAAAEFAGEPVQAIPDSLVTDPAKVALGQKMYNDARISKDGTISCAYCHILKDGGADEPDTRTSEGINGQFGGINAPTVFNAYFNVDQFWNGRAHSLADQAAGPPVNPVEMGDQTWDEIVARLREDKALATEFAALYPDEGLTQYSVTDAIQQYEMTLLTPNDKLDKYLKGDKTAMSAEELAGYQAFKNNACATCHVGKTLGGQSFEYMGIFENYLPARAESHPEITENADDKGLYGFTGKESDMYKFKVPNLRNLSKTAPYYHDGSMATIEDAVSGMFRFELGKEPEEGGVKSISTFLRALDGESLYFE